jgi:hypothetical protein
MIFGREPNRIAEEQERLRGIRRRRCQQESRDGSRDLSVEGKHAARIGRTGKHIVWSDVRGMCRRDAKMCERDCSSICPWFKCRQRGEGKLRIPERRARSDGNERTLGKRCAEDIQRALDFTCIPELAGNGKSRVARFPRLAK